MEHRPVAPATDVAIVGAGILGLAVAREVLRRRPATRLTVFEREPEIATHQTGHNSGVVHAGIYYLPDSLKAQLCVRGARALYRFCEEHRIRFERCGKVIVALAESELPALDELERRGRANGVDGLSRLDPAGLAEIEPNVRGVAALHSPETAIVDYPAVAAALAAEITAAGAEIATGCGVSALSERGSQVLVEHERGQTCADRVIACAGAWSDRLARSSGAPADPRIVPFRGAYMRLRPERRGLVNGLVYPVPNPELPFLGIHVTRHVSGDVLLGPSALLVGARDAYRLRRVNPRDLAETLVWPGTARVMRRWWRTGVQELRFAASKRAFVEEAARYVPGLRLDDVVPGPAGIRAQAVSRDGRLVDDFVFSETSRTLHVRNAPSPGATSALAIAEHIVDRADAVFGWAVT
ncbi:MAG TPA: L-2-hydroxyglutarate oxidase [Plantibacter sp.]|uniref:L-2-hydroxyglutarate oxidase n=1 Tax=Plantibacter sp. TaxID=1871045 RepID=UPI002BBE5A50|nr:L-2-hydroxyglutarate oxidase [Plantibacter sp.]